MRDFTEQAAHDYDLGEFITIRNQFYLDAALTWKQVQVWHRKVDIRLAGQNITDNRHEVGGTWLRDTYRPRGTSGVLTVYFPF